ncbi:MAG: DNA polymerase [Acidimicrobiales bacterium]
MSSAAGLAPFARAVAECVALAVDTETHIGTGRLRVVSAATRDAAGIERAWVIDARDTDPAALAPILAGRIAAGWNANFDAAVLDAAVFDPAGTPASRRLRWFDAMFADALLHQGRSGFAFYHGLAWAARHYLGVETEGKGTVQLSYDLDSDLSAAQIAYAGADAVTTLWVADRIGAAVRAAGLSEVAGLEMAARPFLDQLSRRGFPFDADGYRAFLADQQTALHRCESELAELTGGGQGNLFSTEVEPTWNPASEAQAKVALNRHAAADVHAYFARAEGRARGLEPHDPLTAAVLAEIGGPVAGALLRYRHHAKLVSTYGDSLLAHVGADGRIRPQYLQVVGTSTGRLASRYPNAQNLAPETKPFVRPADGRVLVHADLSQAELRWMAQVSGDRALQAALADGGDVHVATAARMFGEDVAALRERDPARYGELRARAKAINFGILYGLGARALARSLSRPGAEVTVEAAQQLLDAYLAAYPGWPPGCAATIASSTSWPPTRRRSTGAASNCSTGSTGSAPGRRRSRRSTTGRRRWPSCSRTRRSVRRSASAGWPASTVRWCSPPTVHRWAGRRARSPVDGGCSTWACGACCAARPSAPRNAAIPVGRRCATRWPTSTVSGWPTARGR